MNGKRQRDEGAVMLSRLLAAERDALEAFELPDHLLDAGATSVEYFREERRAVTAVTL